MRSFSHITAAPSSKGRSPCNKPADHLFHFRFMHIMFRWFSAPKIYAAPAHAVTNMFHRLQLLLNATFLAHNETFFTPSPPQGGILLCSANIMILLHNFSHLLYCSAASPGRFLVSADFCNFVGLFMKI